jgi:hypothetical protein
MFQLAAETHDLLPDLPQLVGQRLFLIRPTLRRLRIFSLRDNVFFGVAFFVLWGLQLGVEAQRWVRNLALLLSPNKLLAQPL